jgi:FlaA1/EpsC-like NDP-sugar epimerase
MNYDIFFKNKKILIIGGTGSIGSEILRSLVKYECKSIVIFSRDEYKQYKLRHTYTDNGKINYILGDIRDFESINAASCGVDMIFHCAALKHVPISEEMPEEFIKTNILGSLNVYKAAINNRIETVVSVSSDKAVHPSNLMGLTKAVQEKIFSSNRVRSNSSPFRFVNVRFGNVIGTHGSLFPILYHQIMNNKPITLTNSKMTRFFMSSDEAIKLIFWAALNGKNGDIVVKKMKSVYISKLIDGFLKILSKGGEYPIRDIGIRVGEKLDETLITEAELTRTIEKEGYYVVKPYTPNDIKKDTIPNSGDYIESKIDIFCSNNQKNLITNQKLREYIKGYIESANIKNDFI